MITKRDLIVSVLCTFCLATVLFTLTPVQSAEWDPWLDVKEDGRINVLDLIKTAGALGTMGDTTKNVSVTNWPQQHNIGNTLTINMTWVGYGFSWGGGGSILIDTIPYSKISFFIMPLNMSITGYWPSNGLCLAINALRWRYQDALTYAETFESIKNLNLTISGHDPGWYISALPANLFDVKGPSCNPNITPTWKSAAPSETGWITFKATWYLRSD